jgi:alpha-tubulin suppressor-like RCC1 family protein
MQNKLFRVAPLVGLALGISACGQNISATAEPKVPQFSAQGPTNTDATGQLQYPAPMSTLPSHELFAFTATPTAARSPFPASVFPRTPTVTATPPAQQLSYLHMIDKGYGWGWDGQEVLITEDGGHAWRVVSPDLKAHPSHLGYAFFALDKNQAWLLSASLDGKKDRFNIWRTVDGGKHWGLETGFLPKGSETWGDVQPLSIQFSNNLDGWARMYINPGFEKKGYYAAYKTNDSGEHWLQLSISVDDEANICNGKLAFDYLNHGWWTGDTRCGHLDARLSDEALVSYFIKYTTIHMQRSMDGGMTWEDKPLAAPTDLVQDLIGSYRQGYIQQRVYGIGDYGAHSIGFYAQFRLSDVSWGGRSNSASSRPYRDYFFISFDAGVTWKIIPLSNGSLGNGLSISPDDNLSTPVLFSFLDRNAGWALVSTVDGKATLVKTADGGTVWTTVAAGLSWRGELQFIDNDNGWAWGNTFLCSTSDGGRDWKTITFISPVALSTGFNYTCLLKDNGRAMCWGDNEDGKLGDGTTTGRTTPAEVRGLESGVNILSAGAGHTCALLNTGGVMCWGGEINEKIDTNGFVERRSIPVLKPSYVSGLTSGVTAISAGYNHTCAIMMAGGVKCWGINDYGQLGDGTTSLQNTPVDVNGINDDALSISAGMDHTCVLFKNGRIDCWGRSQGNGADTDQRVPIRVMGADSGVVNISAGGFHTCVLSIGGGVRCWGDNHLGQLGDGTTNNRIAPADVIGLTSDVTAISAGWGHTCAITSTGRVKCWGNNEHGELGDGTQTNRLTPVDVSGLSGGVRYVSAGVVQTCALTANSTVKCWGSNYKGQLGDGTTVGRLTPVDVKFP